MRYDPEYTPRPPAGDDFVLFFDGDTVLLRKEESGRALPRHRAIARARPELNDHLTYLFSIDDKAFFLAARGEPPFGAEYRFEPVKAFRTFQPSWQGFAGITAHHLHNWYATHAFCGACGESLRHSDTMRALLCGRCGFTEYPRISPAVIVGLTHGDKLLVTKYAGRDYAKYSLIAGFVEVGETLEDTVRREVKEEVGLEVTNIRYYKSQPWAFSGSLLTGFFAELQGADIITLDREELSEALWVHGRDIGATTDFDINTISLTSEMIALFRAGNYPR